MSKTLLQTNISEKQIENQILTFLRNKGIFVWKNQSVGVFNPTRGRFMKSSNPHHINGVADILGCIDGRMLAIEVKKPYISKKTLQIKPRSQMDLEKLASDDQILFINNMKALGAVAFYADSLDVVKEQLKDLL
jgi:hypothetical protein